MAQRKVLCWGRSQEAVKSSQNFLRMPKATIAEFIKKFVKTDDSQLYTDQYKGDYNDIGKEMKHETLNRSRTWESGEMHTNTIEGFWSFVKRAWYGSHHHYSKRYTPLYLAEACYKYNYRDENIFAKVISGCFP